MIISGVKDRVALVTGAAGGIGEAIVRALAAQRAAVAAVDVDAGAADALAAGLRAAGHTVTGYCADVCDSAAADTVVKRVETEMGPIAILVNVAGVLRVGPAVELEDADWAAVFAVNTSGVFHFSRAVARHMIGRRSGVIITIGSNAGGVPRMNMAAYSASKAATSMFSRCLGLELAEHGVRCNVISPGSTDTAMLRELGDLESVIAGTPENYKVGIPLRKVARPADVAAAVLFLASDEAGHITMQDLYVDGGAALRA
ncbi:2,3-dihydro-2,3-dihydroxybenzoate dehydrogenase [Nonomuraea typhae]|uniref:2,3-dihydro-2,3-dihydroxybenzoate dehydrogenase n=1 Tax=Nonomuraea typhae TaxID=2603600 RepID=A0ABW7YQ44_9ACTN